MFVFRKNIFLPGLLFFSTLIFSQTYNFKNYNTEQGLAQSQVLSIYQDHNGYMWFGTNGGGATKFDGSRFKTVSADDGLADNIIFSIIENQKQELLFGTSKGLSVFNGLGFVNYNEKQGLKNTLIYKLINSENKTLIGTQEGVFVYEDNKISSFNSDTVLNKSSVYTIYVDKHKNVWFGTLQNGLIYYNARSKTTRQFKTTDGLNSDRIFSISQKANGDMLIGTEYGLNKINQQFRITKASEIPGNDNIAFNCIVSKGKNDFYLGTSSEGIKYFDFSINKVKANYNGLNGLTFNPIQCIFKDREENLWIGTNGSGVFKYFNNKFVVYNKVNGFSENYVNSVNVDSYNNIWVGLKKNGLVKISANTLKKYVFDLKHPNDLPDNDINAILPLDNGKLLFGTSDGLCFFENEKIRTIGDESFRHKYILSLFEDTDKQVWIGTTEGVYKLNGNKIEEEGLLNKYKKDGRQFSIFYITEDKQKRKWICTETGLILLDAGKTILFNSENKFISSLIVCAVIDSKNNMWIGTEEGLYFYDNSTFKKIDKTFGLGSVFINFLQIDKKENLIIGTNNGIDILNINSFYNKNTSLKHLGKDDGLISLESNYNASAKDTSGRILIGTINGLEIYDPKSDIANRNEAQINITDIKLFFGQENIFKYAKGADSVTALPKNLVLSFSKNNITFQFVGISLMAPEKVLYQYKLEGLDNDWTPPNNKTEASYPSLPPGKYTFMVKAMNNDGLWNKKPATYSFEILPPWYNTWWFYLLCVLIIVTGVICYNYIKTRKLVADKQKLEREVNERTKELREEKEKVEIINKEVSEQKSELEHTNREITDSIKYAKNIQVALLPSLIETEKAFDNCFILYLPKDIVSGDFFWFSQNQTTKYIAAADCTGHGVPGAFMSIVGNTLLNEIVEQKKIAAPGDILLELHKGVKIALNQSNQDSQRRDGMDIALCAIKKGSNTIEYSGANRPLWIYRKNNNYELEIIKPNKFPIGGLELEENRTYSNHTVEVFKDDYLYFFSDGYADQFGGPRGKKFMLSSMQKLLFENLHLSMPEQKQKIKDAFDAWKNNLEQVDDVCVIGIKI